MVYTDTQLMVWQCGHNLRLAGIQVKSLISSLESRVFLFNLRLYSMPIRFANSEFIF